MQDRLLSTAASFVRRLFSYDGESTELPNRPDFSSSRDILGFTVSLNCYFLPLLIRIKLKFSLLTRMREDRLLRVYALAYSFTTAPQLFNLVPALYKSSVTRKKALSRVGIDDDSPTNRSACNC